MCGVAMYSREHETLTEEFRLAQNHGGSPAWASVVEVNKGTFCECTDQNILKIIMKLDLDCLVRQKGYGISQCVLLFHPNRGPAGLPT